MQWSVPRGSGGRGKVSGPTVDGYSWGKSVNYLPLVAVYENVILIIRHIEYLLFFHISYACYA